MGAVMQSNAIFLTIGNGQICKKVQKATSISKERVNKNGVTVHEEYYKGWKGQITAIAIREHQEYGKFWNITLTDNDGDAILQMNYSSGYASAFLKMLPNIDLNGDIVITPNLKIEGDKKKTGLFITQHGVPVKWYFTKNNPNGLPPLEQKTLKGKKVWDDTEMMAFLEKMVNTEIIPKLPKGRTVSDIAPDIEEVEADTEDISKDDLPF
jgi:hypothetical protein